MTNIGISPGALLAGWAVQAGTHSAYQLLVIGNTIAFAASAALLIPLPSATPALRANGHRAATGRGAEGAGRRALRRHGGPPRRPARTRRPEHRVRYPTRR
ncbi:hypothetical protein ABZ958_22180 [Streptomyces sp. NPDC046237]|uniref:hypothetical protein n=1 Tax=Streptomyces sp. NPDC046237 TaxID=3154914 RepID=UPI0033DDD78F